MKKHIFVLVIMLLIFGCKSTKETVINPIDENAKKMIEEVELLLLDYKESNDKYDIQKANLIIKKLEEISKNNKVFEAKVIGLTAERDIALKNFQKIESYISEIEKRNKNEEKLFAIKSTLVEGIDDKIKILSEGIKKTEENKYLKLLLAENYFKKGEFDKSVNLFDEVLIKLSDKYKEIYGFTRDLAYKFVKNPPDNLKVMDILSEKEITFNQLLEMIFTEADFLPADIIDSKVPINDLFKKIISYGYVNFAVVSEISLNSKIERKDLAYFLTYFAGRLEHDPKLIIKYAKISSSSAADDLSPIRDISTKDYFYSAVLVVIERELMDLPDGDKFFPDNYVSGLDLYGIVKKLNSLY